MPVVRTKVQCHKKKQYLFGRRIGNKFDVFNSEKAKLCNTDRFLIDYDAYG